MTVGFWRLHYHESLGSTSVLCTSLAAAGEPEGLAVMALRQTEGRGSRGRQWQSPAGNLYISVLLRPRAPSNEGGSWALLSAVAVADAVATFLPDASQLAVKWPNDVLLDGRKLCGILIDASAKQDGMLDWLVIGCGVNLAHAPDVPGRRTAALAERISPPSPRAMAEILLERLAHWRGIRARDGFGAIRTAWLERAQPMGAPMQLTYNGQLLGGTFAGLADDGSLLLDTGSGVKAFATGEILLQAHPAGG